MLRLGNVHNPLVGETAALPGDGLSPSALTRAVLKDPHGSAGELGLGRVAFPLPSPAKLSLEDATP